MLTRRRVLRGISTVALAASLPAMAQPAGAPADRPTLDRYIAWLAHEHQAALMERYGLPADQVPMGWVPEHVDVSRAVALKPPSARAAKALKVFVDP